jgi:hypothetical protein
MVHGWQHYRRPEGIATDREIAETAQTLNGTEQAFRLRLLRWPNPQPNLFKAEWYCYHTVAADQEEPTSEIFRYGVVEGSRRRSRLDFDNLLTETK